METETVLLVQTNRHVGFICSSSCMVIAPEFLKLCG